MRIISGKARGLKLQSLDGPDTRPTLDNVKEAIFSMLFDKCPDARVLDLFAGSGAMGIEALSRGAEYAVFADSNPKACAVVKANLDKARFTNDAKVFTVDAESFLKKLSTGNEKFDIIFLDPPYALGLMDKVIELISEYDLLAENGVIVCEYDNGTDVDIKGYVPVKNKRYGRVCVTILSAE